MPAHIPPVHIEPITHQCIYAAAQYQQLPVELLYAVMEREGGKVGTVKQNKDGSKDLGVFQINSRWLPMFAHYGISKYDLIYNGCVSAQAGAFILKREILRAGDFWTGVGNYHSHTPKFHTPYMLHVWKTATEIQHQIAR